MRRSLSFAPLLVVAGLLASSACKKPEPAQETPVPTAAPVPTDAAPAELAPLVDDAGFDAGVDAAVAHHGGPGLSTNQLHAKQCCAAIRAQGKTDPMIGMMANQCDAFAAQLGPTTGGSAPELAPLRNLLKNAKAMPAICQGL